jgi:hypothetical protein
MKIKDCFVNMGKKNIHFGITITGIYTIDINSKHLADCIFIHEKSIDIITPDKDFFLLFLYKKLKKEVIKNEN